MTIFDKDSPTKRSTNDHGDIGLENDQFLDYAFSIEPSKPITAHNLLLNKDQIIKTHSHSNDALHFVTEGEIKINDCKTYCKGDWYFVKKGTNYNVKALENTRIFGTYIGFCQTDPK